jgi:hypothetical protein
LYPTSDLSTGYERRQESLPDGAENPHTFLLDITHFIELTINGIDMLGKAGWVVEAGLLLKEAGHSKPWNTRC